MPIHDWNRVDANLFHHFHQMWTTAICNALNAGLLPKGFSALVEHHAAGVVPDVLAVERSRRWSPSTEARGGAVVTAEPPHTRLVLHAKDEVLASRGSRITIRHPLGEIVSVIEVVSPGNKSSRSALKSFVDKTVDFLRQGIHVLVIDLLPPTRRDPEGIHKVIWDEFQDELLTLPADKPFTLVAYVASLPKVAYIEFVGVGDPLPDMPAYLDLDSYVPVPLESTYQSAWSNCPEDMRDFVKHGGEHP
jgi:hypothetical protein